MEERYEETEIDLVEVFHALVAKIWLIILLAALGFGMMVGYTMLFVKPTYSSSSTIYILTKTTSITSLADFQIGTQLTQDYKVIITSRPVLEEVIQNLGLNTTYDAHGRVINHLGIFRLSVDGKADIRPSGQQLRHFSS